MGGGGDSGIDSSVVCVLFQDGVAPGATFNNKSSSSSSDSSSQSGRSNKKVEECEKW